MMIMIMIMMIDSITTNLTLMCICPLMYFVEYQHSPEQPLDTDQYYQMLSMSRQQQVPVSVSRYYLLSMMMMMMLMMLMMISDDN